MTDEPEIFGDFEDTLPSPHEEVADIPVKPRRPWWKRVLKGFAIAVAVLVLLAVLVYEFGGMMPPSAEAKAQYAQLVAAGQQPPVPNRLHIPIPGCVCHSPDPVLQVQHSTRSMNQCASCHGGGGPVARQ